MTLLSTLEILQVYSDNAAAAAVRAADMVGQLAVSCGASVYVPTSAPITTEAFYGRGKQPLDAGDDLEAWATAAPNRVLLIAAAPDEYLALSSQVDCSAVIVSMPSWHSEATLMAECGLADLLGDPNREPLIPAAYYAAGTIGLAGFTALTGVHGKQLRYKEHEVARIDGLSAMSWINWKAAAAGAMGEEYHREGDEAEWPILECKDGYIAFLFTERDWDGVIKMVGDDRLKKERLSTFKGRAENRDEYMPIIRSWAMQHNKEQFLEQCYKYSIPGAPLATVSDLLKEPLLNHRQAFVDATDASGNPVKTPVAPYRVAAAVDSPTEPGTDSIDAPAARRNLPLSGKRILDLGIITAGAGTSGLLADMGAEVIKIESPTYPDPFRLWAGAETESPLFNFNNRNKYGVALDLKNPEDKKHFFKLVESADAVVENFRRGVMERLGITLDTLREHNPNIVLASISGQGLDGPYADHTTFGSTLEALCGFASLTAYDDVGLPYITGRQVNFPDQTVCFYGAAMIAAAMLNANLENRALQIDVAQRDVALYLAGPVFEAVSSGAPDDIASVRKAFKDGAFSGMFKSADDRWVAISLKDESELYALDGVGSFEELPVWTSKLSAADIESELRNLGIGAATALYGSEMFKHPSVQKNNVFLMSPTKKLVKGFPFQFSNSPMSVWGDAPKVGEHNPDLITEE